MVEKKLKKLNKFETASFALWNSDNIQDTEYVKKNRLKLHTKVIIVGLNPSAGVTFLKNFHVGGYDHWYREAFSKKPFCGAYMTDLIKKAEPIAKVISEKWKNSERFRNENIRNIKKQFQILGSKCPVVVCIGYKAYDFFTEIGIESKCVYRLKHPNSYREEGRRGKFIDDAEKLGKRINCT